MKQFTGKIFLALLLFSGSFLVSCKGKQSDADIKAAIDNKIKDNNEMAGVHAVVSGGVVTLTGECKDDECRKSCADKIEDVKGVKNVVNNITIPTAAQPSSPQVNGDDALKNGITNVLKTYSTVQADVNDGVITLRGEIKRADLQSLLISVNELKPRKIDNQLAIK
ncbi:MAG TPA: BON domain-containing protein [Flavitalea sp.]|nr:BON domain-containing protein [Flavitalea sp.]